jgi:pimeloyl-ACP methyl ester carboxylesterase
MRVENRAAGRAKPALEPEVGAVQAEAVDSTPAHSAEPVPAMRAPVGAAEPEPLVPAWVDRAAYPFAQRWVRLPSGHRMHTIDEGEGEPILFVHGTPSWSFEWRGLVRSLAARHRCIAPDHLGFGLSDRPADGAYTPEWHAENLRAFVSALGVRDFTLVVHDYGGPIGLPLALAGRARRLVVLNSFGWSLRGDRRVERASRLLGSRFGRFVYRWLNLSLRVIVPAAYADRRKLTRSVHAQYLGPFGDRWSRGAVLWPLARALVGSSAYYEELWSQRDRLWEMPALIVWGTKDPAFGPELIGRWREALPGARVLELPVGHWPQEEAPSEVAAALGRFLAETGAQAGT